MPRLAQEERGASRAGSTAAMASMAVGSPGANTAAVASGGEAARGIRSRPGDNAETQVG